MSATPHAGLRFGGPIFNLTSIYLLIALITIALPVLIHSAAKVDACANWGYFHAAFFHVENWSFEQFTMWGQKFHFEDDEIWELFAIIQAASFSLLLIFEPEEKTGIRRVFLIVIFIILSSLAGIFALGFHFIKTYQILVFTILLSFIVADICMFKLTKLMEYKMAVLLVDVPIILAMVFLTLHIGIPMKCDHHSFFSGAIAFQLIFGNSILFIIRLSKKLFLSNNGSSPDLTNTTQAAGA